MARSTRRFPITTVTGSTSKRRNDVVAVEEPLEVRVVANREHHSIAVTMRTPGEDFELAAGFLYSEGVIRKREEIAQISYCVRKGGAVATTEQQYNIVNVYLAPGTAFDPTRFTRNVYTTSS